MNNPFARRRTFEDDIIDYNLSNDQKLLWECMDTYDHAKYFILPSNMTFEHALQQLHGIPFTLLSMKDDMMTLFRPSRGKIRYSMIHITHTIIDDLDDPDWDVEVFDWR